MKYFSLPNGFEVYFENNDSKTVYGELQINLGSIDEKEGEEGFCHFIEHIMLVSSTKNLSTTLLEEKKFNLISCGGATSKLQTKIIANFLPEDVDDFLDIVKEITLESNFDVDIFESERTRVLRETEQKTGNRDYRFMANHYCKYLPDVHFRRPLGFSSVVEKVTRYQLYNFYKEKFVVNNMRLLISGTLDNTIIEKIIKTFAHYEAGYKNNRVVEPVKSLSQNIITVQEDSRLNGGKNSLSYINISFLVGDMLSADYFKLLLLQNLLSGNQSKLHKIMSREQGLTYSVGVNYISTLGYGEFRIRSKVLDEKKDEAVELILQYVRDLSSDLSELELCKAKKKFKYFELAKFNTNRGKVTLKTSEILTRKNFEDVILEIDSISIEDMKNLIEKYFYRNYALNIITPKSSNS